MSEKMAVRCPWCGMLMTLCVDAYSDGTITGAYYECVECKADSPYIEDGDDIKAAAYSAAMARWVEPLKPMTLREVQCFSECPVILVEHLYESLEWHHTNYIIDHWAHPDAKMSELYDMTWRCWNPLKGRPTDEAREAAKWGNSNA